MSRKDPRARMLVPVSAKGVAWLRARARGRSLGDALRRVVEAALDDPVPPRGPHGVRRLPLQLPRGIRARLERLAQDTGRDPADLVAAMLVQTMGKTGKAPPSTPKD